MMDLTSILTISLILNAFFIFATMLYPGWLKVALSKSLLIVVRNDRVVDITNAKYEGGLIISKKYGIFIPEQDDVLIFNKKPCAIVSDQYAKPVRIKIMPLLRKLKKMGIKTYHDFANCLYIARNRHLLSADGGALAPQELKIKQHIESLINKRPELLKAADFIDELEKNNALHESDAFVNVSDLVDYLEEQNPVVVEGIIERRISQERRKLRSPITNFMPYVIMFLMLLFGVAIVWKMLGSGGVSAVQNAASNLPIGIK